MGILILLLVVLAAGVWIGFVLGFSKSMRVAATRMQSPSKRPLLGRLIVGAGCLCLLVAIGATLYSWNFIRTARRTSGKVTGLREQTDNDSGQRSYAATFSFRDDAGVEHTIESSLYSDPPLNHVGDTVSVLYQPAAPDGARVDGFWHHWALTTVAGLLGALYVPGGLVVLHWPRIRARLGRSRI
jgi:hypothetical protein